ncbi:unnamed protein product [Clonostachys byssicola]|uniref:Uncharacterized protein n=1 Tax=Clonostachys byssicola TaxID=160290 RepID=A0A9N9UFY5_9HYPO|nr:unnamed protein product [Clonostachys byssicola]
MVLIFLASYRTEILVQSLEELGKGWRLSTRFEKLHHLHDQLVDAAMPARSFADECIQANPEDETTVVRLGSVVHLVDNAVLIEQA